MSERSENVGAGIPEGVFAMGTVGKSSEMSVVDAMQWLKKNFGSFPFKNEHSALSFLQAFISLRVCERLKLSGVRPAFIFNATMAGAGKSALAKACLFAGVGEARPVRASSVKGFVKNYEALLMMNQKGDSCSYFFLDDYYGPLKGEVGVFLDSDVVIVRKLGTQTLVRCKNEVSLFITGNGIELSADLNRRIHSIDLGDAVRDYDQCLSEQLMRSVDWLTQAREVIDVFLRETPIEEGAKGSVKSTLVEIVRGFLRSAGVVALEMLCGSQVGDRPSKESLEFIKECASPGRSEAKMCSCCEKSEVAAGRKGLCDSCFQIVTDVEHKAVFEKSRQCGFTDFQKDVLGVKFVLDEGLPTGVGILKSGDKKTRVVFDGGAKNDDLSLMIDLETLGTTSEAAVTEIGCCFFDASSGVIYHEFSRVCDVGLQVANGRKICSETLAWYQNKGLTIAGLSGDDRVGLSAALLDLKDFLLALIGAERLSELKVWMRGGMDQSILDHAYATMGESTPWNHWNVRDVRTAMSEVGLSKPDVHGEGYETRHSALADCRDQVEQVRCVRVAQYAKAKFEEQGRKVVDYSLLSSDHAGEVKSLKEKLAITNQHVVKLQEKLNRQEVRHESIKDARWNSLREQLNDCVQQARDNCLIGIVNFEDVLAMMDREEGK